MIYAPHVQLDQYIQYASRMNRKSNYAQVSKVKSIQGELVYRELEKNTPKSYQPNWGGNRKRRQNNFYSENGKGRYFQEYV
ncbi:MULTISPECIES: hypothetical protein [Bacillus]|uniref:Uncharacterized protein n=2 Tax=Bacillus TaxID=1386 RepID=A0A0M3R943_9BACI|nr:MULTISPECIES: hypothetical protein [Bacillus]ALC80776.1 hypothetical protein AM592_03595 [Bacillus gobiensis]MBP1079680.1 hypothetical protein [Bacillus capparidis]MED1095082.1 hypothetical protein [Bacillus capparidis]